MTVELWAAFVAASSILLIIPGPTVLLVVSYALGQGRRFEEMHADGCASAYVFVTPQLMLLNERFDERLPAERLYVIINSTLRSD